MKLERNSQKKTKNNNEESELSSSLSLTTKKIYAKYIKQILDKEKSINLIDLDIGRTFPYIGVFKKESQLGEDLREILRIFCSGQARYRLCTRIKLYSFYFVITNG